LVKFFRTMGAPTVCVEASGTSDAIAERGPKNEKPASATIVKATIRRPICMPNLHHWLVRQQTGDAWHQRGRTMGNPRGKAAKRRQVESSIGIHDPVMSPVRRNEARY